MSPREIRSAPEIFASRSRHQSFLGVFVLALIIAIGAAAIIAPFAADALALAGFRFPFPRIFDRVVMVAAVVTLLCSARWLRLTVLIGDALAEPRTGMREILFGFAAALAAIVILFAVAAVVTVHHPTVLNLTAHAMLYLPAALTIALIEEAFFRALILGGLSGDFGRPAALIISAAIYALTHLIRAPAHYYLVGLHPAAGLANLVASASRLVHPGALLGMVFGLFLLGLMLGRAFLLTGRIYLPLGLHAGVVLGAKCWRTLVDGEALPRWLAGPGPVPLIAAPAAWLLAVVLFLILPSLCRRRESQAS
ncbi:MAG TPA: CPBP family intramembrane glutamic endopeptidase [Candidatus Binataceae bacterium]|nr:CPBP family intramembrane glutamic endopeptidase [Candidatus Binataceae bacterium]